MDAVFGEMPHGQSQDQWNHHVHALAYSSLLFHQLQAQGKPCGLLIDPGRSQAITPQMDAEGVQWKQVGNQAVA
jgi:hypothetical protein